MAAPEWLRRLNIPLEHIAPGMQKESGLGIPQVEFVQGVPTFVNPVVVQEKTTELPIHNPLPVQAVPVQAVGRGTRQSKPREDDTGDRLLDDSEIPIMPSNYKSVVVGFPLLAITPTKLPEKVVEPVPEIPVLTGEQRYAAVVAEIGLANPTEAKLIARLRLYESQYIGLITTPEQAIEHILLSRRDKVAIGGSESVKPLTIGEIRHAEYIAKRYAPHKEKRKACDVARAEWKKAIQDRLDGIKQWDEFVRYKHEEFIRIKALPVEIFNPLAPTVDHASPLQV